MKHMKRTTPLLLVLAAIALERRSLLSVSVTFDVGVDHRAKRSVIGNNFSGFVRILCKIVDVLFGCGYTRSQNVVH
jgi:hypothetical protein